VLARAPQAGAGSLGGQEECRGGAPQEAKQQSGAEGGVGEQGSRLHARLS
jgi:hypothetical protein